MLSETATPSAALSITTQLLYLLELKGLIISLPESETKRIAVKCAYSVLLRDSTATECTFGEVIGEPRTAY